MRTRSWHRSPRYRLQAERVPAYSVAFAPPRLRLQAERVHAHSVAFVALFAFLVLGLSAMPVSALGGMRAVAPAPSLPETWEARTRLRETIFDPVGDILLHRPQIISQSSDQTRVAFRVDSQEGSVYLVFAAERGAAFPLAGAGTFIIKRSLTDGGFQQAKIFLQDDPGCYIRLFPDSDRTVMDIFLFGEPLQSSVIIPIAFPRLLTLSAARIMEMSNGSVDWSLVLAPSPGPEDQRVSHVAAAIRIRLKRLRDMDDGAMDKEGRMVYIATGMPAGEGRLQLLGIRQVGGGRILRPADGT